MLASQQADPTQAGIQIGPHRLNGRVLLAPMAGITDPPFRYICRQFGAALTTSEMLTSDITQWSSEKSRLRLAFCDSDKPKSLQIAGAEPSKLVEAAQRCEQMGVDIIDINMGCPAKKVCKKWAGSALLQDEVLVAQILTQVTQAVSIPVTLKTRLGWDETHQNILKIATIAEEAGIKMLAIHGRTRCQGYQGEASYELIRKVKKNLSIPVIANGDIVSGKKAKQVLDLTNSDGIMLGRGVWGRPWILRSIGDYIQGKSENGEPTLAQRMDTVLKHLEFIHEFYGKVKGARVARKHIGWYLKNLEQGSVFCKKLNLITCARQQSVQVRIFFEQLIDGRGNGEVRTE